MNNYERARLNPASGMARAAVRNWGSRDERVTKEVRGSVEVSADELARLYGATYGGLVAKAMPTPPADPKAGEPVWGVTPGLMEAFFQKLSALRRDFKAREGRWPTVEDSDFAAAAREMTLAVLGKPKPRAVSRGGSEGSR